MLAEQRAHVLRRDPVLDERHALLDPGLEDRVVGIEVHDRDALRIDLDVPQQDGQRAPRDGPETDEQDSMRKGRHSHVRSSNHRRLELLHQDLGIAAALVVLLAARGRQIVRRAFDEAAFGLKIGEGLRREREQLAQPQLARPVFHELNQLAADALVLVRRADVQARQLALVLLRDTRAGRRTRRGSCRSRR